MVKGKAPRRTLLLVFIGAFAVHFASALQHDLAPPTGSSLRRQTLAGSHPLKNDEGKAGVLVDGGPKDPVSVASGQRNRDVNARRLLRRSISVIPGTRRLDNHSDERRSDAQRTGENLDARWAGGRRLDTSQNEEYRLSTRQRLETRRAEDQRLGARHVKEQRLDTRRHPDTRFTEERRLDSRRVEDRRLDTRRAEERSASMRRSEVSLYVRHVEVNTRRADSLPSEKRQSVDRRLHSRTSEVRLETRQQPEERRSRQSSIRRPVSAIAFGGSSNLETRRFGFLTRRLSYYKDSATSSREVVSREQQRVDRRLSSRRTEERHSASRASEELLNRRRDSDERHLDSRRASEERRMDFRRASEERLDSRRASEERLDSRRASEERRLDSRRASEERLDSRRVSEERHLDSRRASEERRMDSRRASEERRLDSRRASEVRRLDSRSYEEQPLESRSIAGKDRQNSIWASQELHLNSRKARALQHRLSLPGDGLDFSVMFKRQSAEVIDDVDEKKLLHDTYLHIPGQKTRTDAVLVQKIPYHFDMTDFTSEFSDNENSYKQERSVGDILMKGLWTGLATLALYHTRRASGSKLAVC